MTPLALVLDLDDTLYPEREFVRSGFIACDRLARSEGIDGFAERALALFAAGQRGAIIDDVLAALAPQRARELAPRLIEIYRTHAPRIALHADAASLLQALANRVPLGLISDGLERTQLAKIDALGIAPAFDRIILTDSLGGRAMWKPCPVAFQQMAAALPARQLVYVGDNPAKDFIAPNALGWLTVEVRRADGVHRLAAAPPGGDARYVIGSLAELTGLLALER